MTLMSGAFFCIHLHCAGVRATLLSAGIFPSRNKPILIIHYWFYGRGTPESDKDRFFEWFLDKRVQMRMFAPLKMEAQMAELVDASDSKSGFRKKVQVRFLFWAQTPFQRSWRGVLIYKRQELAHASE